MLTAVKFAISVRTLARAGLAQDQFDDHVGKFCWREGSFENVQ